MKWTKVVLAVVAAAGSTALGANVIREWAGHNPADYSIVHDQQQGNDRAVIIFNNSQPGLPWKFEAFDSISQLPGEIDYIHIESVTAVAGIKLSIIGDPNSPGGAHDHGAHKLAALDLVTHGDPTNRIDEIDLTGDYGDTLIGDTLRAYEAGTLTIGGSVLNDVDISGAATGPVSIAGLLLGPATLECAWLDAEIYLSNPAAVHTGNIKMWAGSRASTVDIAGSFDGMLECALAFGGAICCTGSLNYLLLTGALMDEASVTIAGNVTTVTATDHLRGLLLIGGDAPTVHLATQVFGAVVIGGAVNSLTVTKTVPSGAIYLGGSLDHGTLGGSWYGDLTIAGDLAGQLWAPYGFAGRLGIFGSLLSGGSIKVGGSAGSPSIDMSGTVTIGADMLGAITIGTETPSTVGNLSGRMIIGEGTDGELGGSVRMTGNMTGDILIFGGFRHTTSPEVEIKGTKAAGARFIVNYNAVNPDDDTWDVAPGLEAKVKIGEVTYSGPNLELNLAAIFCIKGDIMPSGAVDAFDIDPFVEALEDPDGYLASHFYLEGAFDYVVDMNCDGLFDAFDIDPFVLQLTDPAGYELAYPDCQQCPGGAAMGESFAGDGSPKAVAEMLAKYVAPERLPLLVLTAKELASAWADSPKGQFWAEVASALQP